MNFYVVVEGDVEKSVFEKWIPLVNSNLAYVDHPSKLERDNFVIVSGLGYPNYLEIITDAIQDIRGNHEHIKLVASVDSEDCTRDEKLTEIRDHIIAEGFGELQYAIVIQHFCFETWALGNRKVGPRRPRNLDLVKFKQHYNVVSQDPEGLTPLGELNRANLAEIYLRRMLNDKHGNLTYSKKRPDAVAHKTYFDEMKSRLNDTGHIDSFNEFLSAFS